MCPCVFFGVAHVAARGAAPWEGALARRPVAPATTTCAPIVPLPFSAMTSVRGIRGATTVAADDPGEIVSATGELLSRLIEGNQIETDQVAGAWFTTTPDLRSEFPAVAARRLGWVDVPLICGVEMDVDVANPRGISRCIRIMLLLNTEREQREMQSVYLRGARAIREELDRARAGQLPEPVSAADSRRGVAP